MTTRIILMNRAKGDGQIGKEQKKRKREKEKIRNIFNH